MGSAVSIEREIHSLDSSTANQYLPKLLEHQVQLKEAAEECRKTGTTAALREVLAACGVSDESERDALINGYGRLRAYIPAPINTDDVYIPDHLEKLTERLAENAHEEWAAQRMSKGWQHGMERNDKLKHHPCLVPYGDLSDEEKEYDRITAMKTLKLLLSLGYSIDPPGTHKISTNKEEVGMTAESKAMDTPRMDAEDETPR